MHQLFSLIPAAGESRRFKQAGYSIPKPFLPMGKKAIELLQMARPTMLDMVVHTLPTHSTNLAAVPADSQVGHPSADVSYVPIWRKTLGQAETVAILANLIPSDAAVLVHNVDAIITGDLDMFVADCQGTDADAGVVTFRASNPAYSYVTGSQFVEKAAEKNVISDQAVAGVYYFKSAKQLLHGIRRFYAGGGAVHVNEWYLTPILDKMMTLIWRHDKVISWNTPEEYEAYVRNTHT